jgi:hypothetical protein
MFAVKVVCQRGTESTGNAVIPVATLHPVEQVSVALELCPAVNTCAEDRYQYTVPLEEVPLRVAVTGAVIVNTCVPRRIWHGAEEEQEPPID